MMLPGADLAAVAVAIVNRLRGAGVAVAPSGPNRFVQAMLVRPPRTRSEFYWLARLTFVSRMEDLAAFDALFDTVVFNAVTPGLGLGTSKDAAHAAAGDRRRQSAADAEGGVPWATLPTGMAVAEQSPDSEVMTLQVAPSRHSDEPGEPFSRFHADDLQRVDRWLAQAAGRWPRRPSRRNERHHAGKRLDRRATLNLSRRTGWEPVRLVHTRRRPRPRRIVLICDVSRSMRPYTTIYLHLMRAAAQRRTQYRPEVFAFATELTRLTAVLAHRSPEVALELANEKVADRYGGTAIGSCLAKLLASPAGNAIRGAVVVIASDGWDSGQPQALAAAMARIRRRAWRVVWLNPRAGQAGFQPTTAAMAAALPFCDTMLAAQNLDDVQNFVQTLATMQ